MLGSMESTRTHIMATKCVMAYSIHIIEHWDLVSHHYTHAGTHTHTHTQVCETTSVHTLPIVVYVCAHAITVCVLSYGCEHLPLNGSSSNNHTYECTMWKWNQTRNKCKRETVKIWFRVYSRGANVYVLNSCVWSGSMVCSFGPCVLYICTLCMYVSIVMEGFECAIAMLSQMNRKKWQCERMYSIFFLLLLWFVGLLSNAFAFLHCRCRKLNMILNWINFILSFFFSFIHAHSFFLLLNPYKITNVY